MLTKPNKGLHCGSKSNWKKYFPFLKQRNICDSRANYASCRYLIYLQGCEFQFKMTNARRAIFLAPHVWHLPIKQPNGGMFCAHVSCELAALTTHTNQPEVSVRSRVYNSNAKLPVVLVLEQQTDILRLFCIQYSHIEHRFCYKTLMWKLKLDSAHGRRRAKGNFVKDFLCSCIGLT